MQVIGIGKYERRGNRAKIAWRDALYGGLGANRRENGRRDIAMRRVEYTRARRAVLRYHFKLEWAHRG